MKCGLPVGIPLGIKADETVGGAALLSDQIVQEQKICGKLKVVSLPLGGKKNIKKIESATRETVKQSLRPTNNNSHGWGRNHGGQAKPEAKPRKDDRRKQGKPG